MILKIADWRFRVDVDATRARTKKYSTDHCTCGYCSNYYDTVETTYPGLVRFLDHFGIYVHGPCEVMPFEPTLVLSCYRVDGEILAWGNAPIYADGLEIVPEMGEDGTFLLWAGEMELPWVQQEPVDEVISPANLPEFMERMQKIWLLRHGDGLIFS